MKRTMKAIKKNILSFLNSRLDDCLCEYQFAIEAVVLREYANWHSDVNAYEYFYDCACKVGEELFEDEEDAKEYVKKLAKMDLLKELKGVC